MGFKLTDSDSSEFPQYEAIPENTVLLTEVVKVEERDSFFNIDDNDPSLGKKRQVSFRFKVTDPDSEYNGRNVWGTTPTTFSTHPDCKLRVWVQEILGVDGLPKDFEFEEEDLEGSAVKVVMRNYQKKNADGSTTTKDSVSDLMRASGYQFAEDVF